MQLLEQAPFAAPYTELSSAQQHSIRHEEARQPVERGIVPDAGAFEYGAGRRLSCKNNVLSASSRAFSKSCASGLPRFET
jgi:hypothetical protein